MPIRLGRRGDLAQGEINCMGYGERSRPPHNPADDRRTSGDRTMTKVVVVANQKGGVAKTTTAVNMAACLASLSKRTLLIDLDPQGNATSGCGIDRDAIQ